MKTVPLDIKDFPSPRPAAERKNSQFRADWEQTVGLMEHELAQLGASAVVLQVGVSLRQIRKDGWPFGEAQTAHPAVILSFRDAENRPLSFPCDRFISWRANVRAIALSLEALRAVDRFGVTRGSEQYTGFKAIEAARPWSVDEAAQFLAAKAGASVGPVISDVGHYRSAYRVAAGSLHPEKGGNPHEWKLLMDAKELLDMHHGLKGIPAS